MTAIGPTPIPPSQKSPWTIPEREFQTTHEMLLEAIETLDAQNVPMNDRALYVTPEQMQELKRLDRMQYAPFPAPGRANTGTYLGHPLVVYHG